MKDAKAAALQLRSPPAVEAKRQYLYVWQKKGLRIKTSMLVATKMAHKNNYEMRIAGKVELERL